MNQGTIKWGPRTQPTPEEQAEIDRDAQEFEAAAWWLSQDVSPDGQTAIHYGS